MKLNEFIHQINNSSFTEKEFKNKLYNYIVKHLPDDREFLFGWVNENHQRYIMGVLNHIGENDRDRIQISVKGFGIRQDFKPISFRVRRVNFNVENKENELLTKTK
jgi:hypothetical protein